MIAAHLVYRCVGELKKGGGKGKEKGLRGGGKGKGKEKGGGRGGEPTVAQLQLLAERFFGVSSSVLVSGVERFPSCVTSYLCPA